MWQDFNLVERPKSSIYDVHRHEIKISGRISIFCREKFRHFNDNPPRALIGQPKFGGGGGGGEDVIAL